MEEVEPSKYDTSRRPRRQGLAAPTLCDSNQVMSGTQDGPALGLKEGERCLGVLSGSL